MKKLWMIALMILATQFSGIGQKATPQKYQSLLWEITGNGLTKPSYLYGTMHVSNKVAFRLNDTVFNAIKSVDMMASELDFSVWMSNLETMIAARENFEFQDDYNMSAGIYYNCFKPFIPKKKQFETALESNPQIVNTVLYRNSTSKIDYQEDTYIDLYLYQLGKKLNKKTGALEDYILSEKLATRSYEPDADEEKARIKMEKNRMILRELTKGKNMQTLFEDYYRSGDLDMLDSINKLTSSENSFKYMLIARNVIMANSIDSIIKKQSLFSAVGCAHLPGDSGIIEILRSKGYTLRPLPFISTSGIDSKLKKQIEEIRYPTVYNTFTSSDSVFSISLPSKVMELSDDMDGTKNYISFDLVNGGYYYLQRINYYGQFTGKNQEYIKQSVDSLLYETIPGEIISKKEFTASNGYLGIDITNKTNKGDFQRYHIYFSPDEVFIIKYNGTGEYMKKGDEVNNCFKSIRFIQKPSNKNILYTSKSGGFSVQIPSNYIRYKAKEVNSNQREFLSASNKNDYYYVGLSLFRDFSYIEEDTFELSLLSDLFARSIDYKVANHIQKSVNAYPSLDAKLFKEKDSMDVRIVKRGTFYYLLACKSKDATTRKTFFDSFKLAPIEYEKNFDTYVDTTLHFITKMPHEKSACNDLIQEESSMIKKYNSYRYSKKTSEFESTTLNRVYSSTETGEMVLVSYIKHSKFYQDKNLKEYWNKKAEIFTKYNDLILLKKTEKTHPTFEEMNLTLSDTNSKQTILVKMILKCGSLYRVFAPIDSVEGPSRFVKTFYDNFAPQDTCIGQSVFEDNITKHFFTNLYSSDSTTRANTRNAIDYATSNFKDSHVPVLIQSITDTGFVNLSPELKSSLLISLGGLKSPAILPFLENMYPRYSDSIRIQREILKAVIYQRNDPSAATFLRMLQMEIPIASSQEGIDEIFELFNDSLHVSAKLFPQILQYTKYEFLKKPIYNLMAKCIQKDLLPLANIKTSKNEVLRDAAYDMRTLIASNESKNEGYGYSYNRGNKIEDFGLEKNDLSDYENLIYNYSIILQPFYKDKDVQTFINKTINIKIDNLNMLILGYYLKKSIPIRDTLWSNYLSNINTRIYAYKILTEANRIDIADKKHIDHENLLTSYLFNGEVKEEGKKKDSIVFVDKIYLTSKQDSGFLYIFKSISDDSNVWKLAFTGLHFNDGKSIDFNSLINENDVPFETKLQYDTEIEFIKNKIRISKRERATDKDIDVDAQMDGNDYFFFE